VAWTLDRIGIEKSEETGEEIYEEDRQEGE
jgi:hypothetical protein